MRASIALLAALFALVAASSAARADGYVGVGVGSKGELQGDISSHFTTDDNTDTSRILLGQRFGALALEASLFGSELRGVSAFAGRDADYSTVSLGVDLKYYLPLMAGLEAYGKLGINKTWLSAPDSRADFSYEGRGKELGLGLEYTIALPLTDLGVWLDYSVQTTDLRDSGRQQILDGELSMLNLGLSVGF